MDIGISYWFGYPSFAKERVSLLKKYRFNSVSVHWTDEYLDVTGPKVLIPEVLYENDIRISSFHTSYDSAHYLWGDDDISDIFRKEIYQTIEDACKYKVPIIVLHTNGVISDTRNIHYLFDILQYAKKNNITICIENLQKEDNFVCILDEVGYDNISLCYDTGHANIRTCPFEVKKNKNIKYVHINDNNAFQDEHKIPFSGTINWNEEINLLKSLEVSGAILEVHEKLDTIYDAEKYLERASKVAMIINNRLSSEDGEIKTKE